MKRKRHLENVNDTLEGEEEGLGSSGTSKRHPPDRKQILKEAYDEINEAKNILKKATIRIKELDDYDADYMTTEGIEYFNEASETIERGLTSLEQSKKHWLSFLCIPEVPMRHILKYLSFEDKVNFRLSSGSHRDIIDSYDAMFKTIKINFSNNSDEHVKSICESILRTRKDFKVKCCIGMTTTEIEYLNKLSDRIVNLFGPVEITDMIETADKLESLRIENLEASQPHHPLQPLPLSITSFGCNLKILDVTNVDISMLENHTFSFPQLEKLYLRRVQGFSGLHSLLASCSSSLEEICLGRRFPIDARFFPYEDRWCSGDWDLTCLQDSDITLDNVKEISASGLVQVSGLIALLKMASKNLQKLYLRKVATQENPEELDFSLSRLESITLYDCSPYFLSILSCSAPRLNNICLSGMDLEYLKDIPFGFNNTVTKLTVDGFLYSNFTDDLSEIGTNELKRIFNASAATIEDLDLKCYKFFVNHSAFSNLKKICLRKCDPSAREVEEDVVNRSPNLKELIIEEGYDYLLDELEDKESVEKLVIKTVSKIIIKDDLHDTFSKFCNLKEIAFQNVHILLDGLRIDQLKLTKLFIEDCTVTGFLSILNASSSTLEELKIFRSSVCLGDNEEQKSDRFEFDEMKALKSIAVQCYCTKKHQREDTCRLRSDSFYKLLTRCRKTLERLAINLQGDEYLDEELLSLKLDLPSLRVLQMHPTPSKYALRHISSQLPDDVLFWFFPSKDFTVGREMFLGRRSMLERLREEL